MNLKKIIIQNGSGGSGKDTFAELMGKHIPTCKYSIIDLVKEAATVLGWTGSKSEKDRKFLSDLKDLSSKYNDMPFQDVLDIIDDFLCGYIESELLLIDVRDPEEIKRLAEKFNVKTILIKNPNVESINSNHADSNVEEYDYDYIVINDGTLEQLDKVAQFIAYDGIINELIPDTSKPFIFTCSKY